MVKIYVSKKIIILFGKIKMINWISRPPCQDCDDLETWNSQSVSRLQLFCDGSGWKIYKECQVNGISINDEVMWIVVSSDNRLTSCYTGKVEFIGRETEGNLISAVVLFAQDTSHLPGFIFPGFGFFKNIVNVKDLKNLHASGNNLQAIAQMVNSNQSIDVKTLSELDNLSNQFSKLSINQTTANDESNIDAWEKQFDLSELQNQLKVEQVKPLGIQGKDNSCYMDASLFALFGFNHSLDKHIRLKTESIDEILHFFNTVLKEIIKRLRTQFFVEYSETIKLRELLAESYDKQFRNSFMDAEDFILTLFEAIKMQHLFEYDDGYSDYVHQIILPKEWNLKNRVKYQSVQNLVQNSFKASGVKLKHKPNGLFILKLPISNGDLIPCKYVIPDLKLDLATIFSQDQLEIHSNSNASLSAVICFRNSHYVAFAKTKQNEPSSWVFMDSNPHTGSPSVTILKYMDEILNGILKQHYKSGNFNFKHIPPIEITYANRLLSDAYICIYDTSN